ncbi:MAG: hypothetical protein KJN97_08925, partial [Deltaproteobacteria bacterium]|nr:hypothetical protein [Deltaproteobacteria bacterium]
MNTDPAKSSIEAAPGTLEQFVWEPLLALWRQVVAHAPSVATGLVVLIILLIVARLVRAGVRRALRASKIDRAVKQTRLQSVLGSFQKDLAPSDAMAYLVYLAIVLLGWMAATDIMGLTVVHETLSAVLGYLPRLLSALLVVLVGAYLAGMARRAIAALMSEVRNPFAHLLEGLTEFLLLIVVFTLAVNVLGVDVTLITSNVIVFLSVAAITVGFLCAWSMRGPAEDIIANYYVRRMVGAGDEVA